MSIEKLAATIYVSAARTSTPSAVEITLADHLIHMNRLVNLHVFIDVTATNLTPSITIDVEALDETSSTWYSLLTSAAITTVSENLIMIGKDHDVNANVSRQASLPRRLRIKVTHGDADSITYSIGINAELDI